MKSSALTVENVEYLLREMDGNMAAVARYCGVTRQAVWEFCEAHPELKRVRSEAKEILVDDAVGVLTEGVRDKERWAVEYVLDHLGKDRGFGSSKGDVNVNVGVGVNVGPQLAQGVPQFTDDYLDAIADRITSAGTEFPAPARDQGPLLARSEALPEAAGGDAVGG